MGFFKKLLKPKPLKTIVRQALKPSKQASLPSYNEDDFKYSIDLDDWLQGQSISGTGLHRKHPDVRKKIHKGLIEEAMKVYGAVELDYGRDCEESGEFFPLSVDEEKFKCRELPLSYEGDAENPPQKTFRLDKIELRQFVPLVDSSVVKENVRIIKEAMIKKGDLYISEYFNDKGMSKEELEVTSFRLDDDYLYFKRTLKSKKEEKIRLAWIETVDFDEYDEDEE